MAAPRRRRWHLCSASLLCWQFPSAAAPSGFSQQPPMAVPRLLAASSCCVGRLRCRSILYWGRLHRRWWRLCEQPPMATLLPPLVAPLGKAPNGDDSAAAGGALWAVTNGGASAVTGGASAARAFSQAAPPPPRLLRKQRLWHRWWRLCSGSFLRWQRLPPLQVEAQLLEHPSISSLKSVQDGLFYIQDPSTLMDPQMLKVRD